MVSATGYLSKISVEQFELQTGLDTIVLSPIVGHEVQLVLSYVLPAVTASDTSKSYRCYSDYSNLEYKVYDKTAKTSVDDFHVQYPLLILEVLFCQPPNYRCRWPAEMEMVPSAGAFTVTTRKQDTVSLALKQRGAVSVRCRVDKPIRYVCCLMYGKFVRKVTLADNMEGFLPIYHLVLIPWYQCLVVST